LAILEGDLSSVSVEEILELFFVSAKPATLYLFSEEKEGMVCCANGGVVWAKVRGYGEAFGGLLLKSGLISEDALSLALNDQQTRFTDKKLGEILVSSGVITPDDVKRTLITQVTSAVFELIVWKQGSFRVEEGLPVIPAFLDPPLDGITVLMESARRLGEQTNLHIEFPDMESVPHLASSKPDAEFTLEADEWRILTLINGKRSLREIITLSHLTSFDALEVLHSLHKRGIFTLQLRRKDAPGTILIFDSDEDSRSLIEHVLLKKGKSVYQARSLEEAERLVVKNQVSFILLDPMTISDLKSAISLFRSRVRPMRVYIAVISEKDSVTERLRARISGADLSISKPISLEQDVNKILSLLG
jgi:CheY-like chemotaxis protein